MEPVFGPAERALFTKRRKAAYEALHPETKHGENQHTRSRQLGDSSRFTADTAEKTGKSERAVQRDAARGARVEGMLRQIHEIDRAVPLFADARTSAPAYSTSPLRDRLLLLTRLLGAMPSPEAHEVMDLALGRALSSRSQVKRRRREALRAVLELYPRPWSSKTAAAVALDLSDYVVAGWMQDRERGGAPLGDARRQVLFDFMLANNGATLGRTQIWELGIRGTETDSEK